MFFDPKHIATACEGLDDLAIEAEKRFEEDFENNPDFDNLPRSHAKTIIGMLIIARRTGEISVGSKIREILS